MHIIEDGASCIDEVLLDLPQGKREVSRFVVDVRIDASWDQRVCIVPIGLFVYRKKKVTVRDMLDDCFCPRSLAF